MEKNILEGNKLIAEFMGYHLKKFLEGYNATFYYKGKQKFCQPESMKYHSSWDWLMPVVEKIGRFEYDHWEQENSEGTNLIVLDTAYLRTFGMINETTGNPMVRINRCNVFEAPTLIEATWLAVVDFIKSSTTPCAS